MNLKLATLFEQHIELSDDHVLLTPFQPEHAEGFAKIAFDFDIWKVTSPHIRTEEDLRSYTDSLLKAQKSKSKYPFTIIEKASGKVAGCTTYMSISPENNRLEIGSTWLGRDFHGTGLNKHCKFLLFRHAFEELDVRRLELKTDVLNMRSRKAIMKMGAKEDGILRSHQVMPGGRVRDTVYYSVLVHEWPEVRKRVFGDLV
ncbi:RimJ/RimL family protein N-acetyltransferase [Catalinimonas alkaloidigena]|uniref:GNAT family N-acetyltransferase n=1 Tax=Catalinimonas alkaloidigena TaxID=1075417 RepID=UPI002405869C|nr:GNAT family N-acetyltransferase [Catalinimonas alkaloidigena]MDF9800407.1 RimJ/RimL family protein N-acetyltransferase [Catalinimonas alkaloidigena]